MSSTFIIVRAGKMLIIEIGNFTNATDVIKGVERVMSKIKDGMRYGFVTDGEYAIGSWKLTEELKKEDRQQKLYEDLRKAEDRNDLKKWVAIAKQIAESEDEK